MYRVMSCWQLKCCGKECLEFGWCARTPGEACGWPPKTVRAILAISVILIAMMASLLVIVFLVIDEEWDIAVGVMGALLSVGTGVLGYYFGYRSGSSGMGPDGSSEPENPTEPEDSEDEV